MTTVRTQKQADLFVDNYRSELKQGYLLELTVIDSGDNIPLNFAGVKFLSQLSLSGGKAEFPDLMYVDHVQFLGGAVDAPKVEYIGDSIADEDLLSDMADEMIVSGITLGLGGPGRFRGKVLVANDCAYTLKYDEKTGEITAGCRSFSSFEKAIKHWTNRLAECEETLQEYFGYWLGDGEYPGDESDSREKKFEYWVRGDGQYELEDLFADNGSDGNRALMFIFALTNLKEAIYG